MIMSLDTCLLFFFKQKTADEVRISDWSSDVCSSDLMANKESDFVGRRSTMTPEGRRENRKQLVGLEALDAQTRIPVGGHVVDASFKAIPVRSQRSEERRVGQECVSTGRSRW